MARVLKVRPTKIELVRLKRRLSLASRVQKIVKDRLSILTLEFLQIARECVKAKEKLLSDFTDNYQALSVAVGYHGPIALEKEIVAAEGDVSIMAGSRNIAGVRTPHIEMTEASKSVSIGYSLVDTSSWLDKSAEYSQKSLETIIELAELQRSLELLGMEIARAKRITNALEHVLIPGLIVTIKYLN
ncbi:MAG: V-type ATP synthase subunit D, partial [Chloroflexi bacterium]|nr:V-type ATP synthase subunit D [Chloroflexota bacterium]